MHLETSQDTIHVNFTESNTMFYLFIYAYHFSNISTHTHGLTNMLLHLFIMSVKYLTKNSDHCILMFGNYTNVLQYADPY